MLTRLADPSDEFSELPMERYQEMRRVVTPAICHVLERRPKMLRFLPL